MARVEWTKTRRDWTLQESANLQTWEDSATQPQDGGEVWFINHPITAPRFFFRLKLEEVDGPCETCYSVHAMRFKQIRQFNQSGTDSDPIEVIPGHLYGLIALTGADFNSQTIAVALNRAEGNTPLQEPGTTNAVALSGTVNQVEFYAYGPAIVLDDGGVTDVDLILVDLSMSETGHTP
jgi:hypothetical protein